eukprot:snap_masked-scaffold_1-processed-gene-30.43-mRNA-1 protein AED:0.30 eAED:0.64 QI:0/-1/0/1/-1/1/1/0/208
MSVEDYLKKEYLVPLAIGSVGAYLLYELYLKPEPKIPPRQFTEEGLSLYSGKDNRLCYVAVGEDVYNVTSDKEQFVEKQLGGKSVDQAKFPDLQKIAIESPRVGWLLVKKPFTLQDLRKFIGDEQHPPYICAKGRIFEVSRGFYGPNGPYGCFAGRDASRALALHSTDPKDIENRKIDDLSAAELSELDGWISTFESKYLEVGYLVED